MKDERKSNLNDLLFLFKYFRWNLTMEVLYIATESQAKCERKGNLKLVSVAAWMQDSVNNHETCF